MKKVLAVRDAPPRHWVGDGFPVRSMFSYQDEPELFSPFLLLDHAGPMTFEPASKPRGVGEHPHRGFETVTIVYEGEVAHRDSTGTGGIIGPGDVQWMTAASGILHDEFHSEKFTQAGGTLEMVQLWVNLPARDKATSPGYQTIVDSDIPVADLPGNAGRVRVIAGNYRGQQGPAKTFTPMNVWDLRLNQGGNVDLELPDGHTLAIVVLRGLVSINGQDEAHDGQLLLLKRDGTAVSVQAHADAVLLVLGGEPIDEPVVGYGPFVMNSETDIHQAIQDFNSGRFGRMPSPG